MLVDLVITIIFVVYNLAEKISSSQIFSSRCPNIRITHDYYNSSCFPAANVIFIIIMFEEKRPFIFFFYVLFL